MPFIKVYICLVHKKQDPIFLNSFELRQKVWNHIKENGKKKKIFIDTINGYEEHCHSLISLGTDQTMSKIMQLLKGESSFWINQHKLCKKKFEWQDDYVAASVSESMLDRVREYIRNQESHHTKKSFEQEYDEFIEKHGFQKFQG
jgi:REP element-mobilizing transposase RayT